MIRADTDTDAATILLQGLPLLSAVPRPVIERMAAETECLRVPAGAWIVREGDPADCAYIVASGRVEVVAERPRETVIGELRRGAAFGELGLLRDGLRAASVRACRDCALIALSRAQFEGLLRDSPDFVLGLLRVLAEQVAAGAATEHGGAPARTLALVGLDDGVGGDAFAEELARQLRRDGCASALLTAGDAGPAGWAERLAELEAGHDRVVLVAGPAGREDPWNAFCVNEAELIVAVTAGRPGASWLAAPEALYGCELVVMRASAEAVPADRLRPRSISTVASGRDPLATIRALGRRFAGRSVGVVLSGGGARALAHIGAIAELRRSGVHIERIGGVSLGAVIGALVALGHGDDEIRTVCERAFLAGKPSNDYTLPFVSLVRGRKTARMLQEHFGTVAIEELPMPFFCLSADLVSRQPVVHRTGRLSTAVLASLSIPGVFPPQPAAGGRLLVDGGVLDNLPVSVMAAGAEGPVIAIDVTAGQAGAPVRRQRLRPGLAPAVIGLRRLVTGSAAPLPPLSETIMRCVTFASSDTVAAGRRHADVVITPDVGGVGVLEWKRMPEMLEAGARAARHALEEHRDVFAGYA